MFVHVPNVCLKIRLGFTSLDQIQVTDLFIPVALRMAKTLWSFDRSECNRVKMSPLTNYLSV